MPSLFNNATFHTESSEAMPPTTQSLERTSLEASTEPELTWDDATWILTSSFIIFTMQSGE